MADTPAWNNTDKAGRQQPEVTQQIVRNRQEMHNHLIHDHP